MERSSRRMRDRAPREPREFDQEIIDISRVTRVVAGGKRMRFRACVVIGDRKGRVGYAVSKGADVSMAVNKAVTAAKKILARVLVVDETIPHETRYKFGAARVLLKPAPAGTGVIAGGPVRAVIELAGIKNIVTKMQGSRNKINNVKATFAALQTLRTRKS
ncbi:MAG: 30S ribosomal protein S5 [Candidatus Kerfeldbacteria bacterium]|nr:30S ribosomal protein S5 [Candidatus Kerfeldbacteria bacterium]